MGAGGEQDDREGASSAWPKSYRRGAAGSALGGPREGLLRPAAASANRPASAAVSRGRESAMAATAGSGR